MKIGRVAKPQSQKMAEKKADSESDPKLQHFQVKTLRINSAEAVEDLKKSF